MIKPVPGYYGQFSTDMLIELYFPDQKKGICVEVGAADGHKGSNTLYFEKMGWKTLCIEPNPEYVKVLNGYRKIVSPYACGGKNEDDVEFTVFDIGDRNIMSSVSSLSPDSRLVEQHKDIINAKQTYFVDIRKLDTILDIHTFPNDIDFISIDTEGTELDVLKGLDLVNRNITLLVVENNFDDKEIGLYMYLQGYIRDTRWKINDFYVRK